MKAIWLPELTKQNEDDLRFSIDSFHHLIRVQRAQINENILIIGFGNSQSIYTIKEISKKTFTLQFIKKLNVPEVKNKISWAVGYVKKPAMEEIIQRGVELNIEKIFFIPSEFSQKLIIPQERMRNLIESSIIQSNAIGVPEIFFLDSLDELDELDCQRYNQIIMAHLNKDHKDQSQPPLKLPLSNTLLCIGPQGGWSANDLTFFKQFNNVSFIQLPTPILRTEIAVAVMTGFILGQK